LRALGTAGRTLYRRSPHLVWYWSGRDLLACNYATRSRAFVEPIALEILHFFDTWRSAEELFALMDNVSRKDLRTLVRLLIRRTFLQPNNGSIPRGEDAMNSWAEWNPAAGFFHNSTKDLRYADLPTIERLTREKAGRSVMPDPVKRYPGAQSFVLPPIHVPGEFASVLLARRTWRRFGKERIGISAFSTLLGLTAGVQAWAKGSAGQKVALKTSPSGGARHALEVYAVVSSVDGLAPGLYHYASDRHRLELIDLRIRRHAIERYLPMQWWYSGASAIVLFSAVFPREQWRYTHARAYRAVLIEAGHLCQTFCLTATWLGLAPFCSMALNDSLIEADLKLDGVRESVLYAAGVGSRPPGVEWAAPARPVGEPRIMTAHEVRKAPGRILSLRPKVRTDTTGRPSAGGRALFRSPPRDRSRR